MSQTLGDRLTFLQIGNDTDLMSRSVRPDGWTVKEYIAKCAEFARAILKTTPNAKPGGPDISQTREWSSTSARLLTAAPAHRSA